MTDKTQDHIVDANNKVREDFEAWERTKPLGYTTLEVWQAATQQSGGRGASLEAEVLALRKDADLLRVEIAGQDSAIGHLSVLVDEERANSIRYQWLRSRDLEAIATGGVFAGKTPDNVVLNGDDLDAAIDAAIEAERGEG